MAVTGESVIRSGHEQRREARDDARLDWWRDARFGMFIHWGLYAVPAGHWHGELVPGRNGRPPQGEWIQFVARIPGDEYGALASQFNPVEFDADAWVSLASRAGQKYLVITAKHHDGFCLFDSKATDFDIVDATPFGRDPIMELARACQEQGIKLCFYYSQTQDWHHPGGVGNDWDGTETEKDFAAYLDEIVKPHLRELLTNYGPIGLIWFDTPREITAEHSRALADLVHELQPECLVNGRVGNGFGDYAQSGDNKIPDQQLGVDWETPATMNDTWGYIDVDQNWKSPTELIRKLVDIVSKGGNYLLNVGPTAEGLIPEPSVDRLEAMGQWLAVNGDAIYGATAGPVQGLDWCRTTARPGAVFVHVFDWPEDGTLVLPPLRGRVAAARILARGAGEVKLVEQTDRVVLQGPAEAPDAASTVIRLDINL